VLEPHGANAVQQVDDHPHQEANQELGQQGVDVDRDGGVQQGEHQEKLRNRQPGLQQADGEKRRRHHEQRVEDVVRRDDAREPRGIRTFLYEGVQRHAVEPAERTQQHDVEQHPEARGTRQERADRRRRFRVCSRLGEVQVDREQAQAERAERYEAQLDAAAGQLLAEQRAGGDADGERHEQERGDFLAAVQHREGVRRHLQGEQRAVEPEPGDAEYREEHAALAACVADDAPRLLPRREADDDIGVGCPGMRDAAARQVAEHRDADEARGERQVVAVAGGDGDSARQQAEDDGEIGARLDQRVAADELCVVELLRQVRVLHRAEQRRLRAHEEQDQQQGDPAFGDERCGREQHEHDLEQLDAADQERLLVLVRELAREGGKQEEGQDEQRAGEVDERRGFQARDADALEDHQDDEAVAEDVVVERAQELGHEERREAPLTEQCELRSGHRRRSPRKRAPL